MNGIKNYEIEYRYIKDKIRIMNLQKQAKKTYKNVILGEDKNYWKIVVHLRFLRKRT